MNDLDDLIDESLDRLVPARHEQPDWDDVLARLQPSPTPVTTRPRPRARRLRWLLPITATLAAGAAALVVTAPWKGGPSVIAKANAAISAGSTADVLHERATIAPLITKCMVDGKVEQVGKPHCPKPLSSSIEVWVEGGIGPRDFRVITRRVVMPVTVLRWIPAGPFGNALTRNRDAFQEIGGTLGPAHVTDALVYQRYSNTLIRFTQAPTAIPSDAFDPVSLVRHALAAGEARVAGDSVVGGRRVRVIDVRLRDLGNHPGTATYYVDRSSYAPVEIVYHHVDFLQFPYVPVFDPTAPFGAIVRFSTFERLPATKANRSLTSIRSQHKTAKVVCGQEFGLPDC
jgi:hypothetical protein